LGKDYSDQIKKLRTQLGLTQHALAELLKVRPPVVASWEQGRKEPSAKSYHELARVAPAQEAWFFLGKVGITRDFLRSKLHNQDELQAVCVTPEIRLVTTAEWKQGSEARLRFQVQVPVLRDEAAAGSPREINERDIDSFIAVPAQAVPKGPGSYMGIYIRGDSMEPVLRDRFIVVVDHTNHDPERLRGRMVAALINGGVIVKELARESRPGHWILRSFNPSYSDIVVPPGEDAIIGDVVFWWGTQ
jgi:SOS-response transcriptional repressor LexA